MAQSEIRNVWEARLADFQSSGLSGSQWCELNQVPSSQFYYWKRKLMYSASPASQWVTIQVDTQPINNQALSLFVKVGSAVIEVKPGFNRDLLSDVVRALQSLC